MNFWNNFAAKHPAAAKWVREGGLFVIVSNLITVFKYLLLQFCPYLFLQPRKKYFIIIAYCNSPMLYTHKWHKLVFPPSFVYMTIFACAL